ncbi:Hypothetical predicted protein [Paramuricea clavata]|uniref:Uncharacterized protein n=1 Tax=Paramuricea clavata TaxID=317549 RepID=A0A7D9JBR8_PARCT|nr:Hypothetical predicted protein [Paramuricea clavata]
MAEVNQEQVQVEENNAVGFYERLTALPVVSEAINQTGAIYNAVKGHNGLTQYACDTGESVVKRVTATAYTVGTPIAGLAMKVAEPYVGNPVTTLDHVAEQTLAKCEETFPIITKPPAEIVSTTVDAIKGKAGDCYNAVNNTRVIQFTHARVNEAISLSELAVEVILPASPDSPEDVGEEEQESLEMKNSEVPKGHAERVLALGHRIKRRGSKKLMGLKPVQFSYDSVMSMQQNMTDLVHRSQEAGKSVHEAILVIPSLAIKLTGEAVVNTKAFIIAFKNTYSLNDLPGSVASASNHIVKPVKDATGRIIGKLLLPPKMVAEYILSSKPIQCLIPNVVVFEEISRIDIEMDELVVDDSDEDTDQMEDADDDGEADDHGEAEAK